MLDFRIPSWLFGLTWIACPSGVILVAALVCEEFRPWSCRRAFESFGSRTPCGSCTGTCMGKLPNKESRAKGALGVKSRI